MYKRQVFSCSLVWIKEEILLAALRSPMAKAQYRRRVIVTGSGAVSYTHLDLRKNSFEEVFFGPVAEKFRAELARGKIPIPTCARCQLRRLPSRQAVAPAPEVPRRGILLENTVICNVDCIGCCLLYTSWCGGFDLRTGKLILCLWRQVLNSL